MKESIAGQDATVRAVVPANGIQVNSGNDGPLDASVRNDQAQIISTDALITSLSMDRESYTSGQALVVSMRIRNTGSTPLLGIVPSPLTTGGAASASYVSGPSATSICLAPDADTTIVWQYTAASTGDITFCGWAYDADSTEVSDSSCSEPAVIQNPPANLVLALDDQSSSGGNH